MPASSLFETETKAEVKGDAKKLKHLSASTHISVSRQRISHTKIDELSAAAFASKARTESIKATKARLHKSSKASHIETPRDRAKLLDNYTTSFETLASNPSSKANYNPYKAIKSDQSVKITVSNKLYEDLSQKSRSHKERMKMLSMQMLSPVDLGLTMQDNEHAILDSTSHKPYHDALASSVGIASSSKDEMPAKYDAASTVDASLEASYLKFEPNFASAGAKSGTAVSSAVSSVTASSAASLATDSSEASLGTTVLSAKDLDADKNADGESAKAVLDFDAFDLGGDLSLDSGKALDSSLDMGLENDLEKSLDAKSEGTSLSKDELSGENAMVLDELNNMSLDEESVPHSEYIKDDDSPALYNDHAILGDEAHVSFDTALEAAFHDNFGPDWSLDEDFNTPVDDDVPLVSEEELSDCTEPLDDDCVLYLDPILDKTLDDILAIDEDFDGSFTDEEINVAPLEDNAMNLSDSKAQGAHDFGSDDLYGSELGADDFTLDDLSSGELGSDELGSDELGTDELGSDESLDFDPQALLDALDDDDNFNFKQVIAKASSAKAQLEHTEDGPHDDVISDLGLEDDFELHTDDNELSADSDHITVAIEAEDAAAAESAANTEAVAQVKAELAVPVTTASDANEHDVVVHESVVHEDASAHDAKAAVETVAVVAPEALAKDLETATLVAAAPAAVNAEAEEEEDLPRTAIVADASYKAYLDALSSNKDLLNDRLPSTIVSLNKSAAPVSSILHSTTDDIKRAHIVKSSLTPPRQTKVKPMEKPELNFNGDNIRVVRSGMSTYALRSSLARKAAMERVATELFAVATGDNTIPQPPKAPQELLFDAINAKRNLRRQNVRLNTHSVADAKALYEGENTIDPALLTSDATGEVSVHDASFISGPHALVRRDDANSGTKALHEGEMKAQALAQALKSHGIEGARVAHVPHGRTPLHAAIARTSPTFFADDENPLSFEERNAQFVDFSSVNGNTRVVATLPPKARQEEKLLHAPKKQEELTLESTKAQVLEPKAVEVPDELDYLFGNHDSAEDKDVIDDTVLISNNTTRIITNSLEAKADFKRGEAAFDKEQAKLTEEKKLHPKDEEEDIPSTVISKHSVAFTPSKIAAVLVAEELEKYERLSGPYRPEVPDDVSPNMMPNPKAKVWSGSVVKMKNGVIISTQQVKTSPNTLFAQEQALLRDGYVAPTTAFDNVAAQSVAATVSASAATGASTSANTSNKAATDAEARLEKASAVSAANSASASDAAKAAATAVTSTSAASDASATTVAAMAQSAAAQETKATVSQQDAKAGAKEDALQSSKGSSESDKAQDTAATGAETETSDALSAASKVVVKRGFETRLKAGSRKAGSAEAETANVDAAKSNADTASKATSPEVASASEETKAEATKADSANKATAIASKDVSTADEAKASEAQATKGAEDESSRLERERKEEAFNHLSNSTAAELAHDRNAEREFADLSAITAPSPSRPVVEESVTTSPSTVITKSRTVGKRFSQNEDGSINEGFVSADGKILVANQEVLAAPTSSDPTQDADGSISPNYSFISPQSTESTLITTSAPASARKMPSFFKDGAVPKMPTMSHQSYPSGLGYPAGRSGWTEAPSSRLNENAHAESLERRHSPELDENILNATNAVGTNRNTETARSHTALAEAIAEVSNSEFDFDVTSNPLIGVSADTDLISDPASLELTKVDGLGRADDVDVEDVIVTALRQGATKDDGRNSHKKDAQLRKSRSQRARRRR